MARPTKYTKDTPSKVIAYLDDFMGEGDAIPSIEGLADYLGITKPTIYDWEGTKPEFSYALAKVRDKQARMLLSNGLTGDWNASMAKMMLTHHGYVERSQVDSVSSDGSMTPSDRIIIEVVGGED